jgi:hypothetical protein
MSYRIGLTIPPLDARVCMPEQISSGDPALESVRVPIQIWWAQKT